MSRHLKILGILYVSMGVVSSLATAYFVYAITGKGAGSFSPDVQHVLIDAGYGTFLLAILALASIGTLVTGYALLKMHRFALALARVFAIFGLFDFPFGTMLGIYTLWVLDQHRKSFPMISLERENQRRDSNFL